MRPPPSDIVLALVVAALAALEIRFNHGIHPKWAALATELPFSFGLVWRRRLPILSAALLSLGMALEPVLGVPIDQPVAPLLGMVIAFYSVGAFETLRRSILGFLVIVPAGIIASWQHHGGTSVKIGNLAFGLTIAAGAYVAGVVVRARTREAQVEARRAERLEGERAVAVADERARIARELHDVLAHSVSVMVVQAGAAEEVLHVSPERAVEPLRTIQEVGRQALAEMSRLVGLLREDSAELGLAPQPGLADLTQLVDQVREAGLAVALHVEGSPRPVPLGVDLSAYRVVQEALTNALKHAGAARATVVVRYGADALELEVVDDGPGAAGDLHSGGHGLVGMRERIAVFGGEFDAGPRTSGGFRVRAVLPA